MPRRLPPCETLNVEFKSDRSKLPDPELIEALICLANAEGGELWLGVEDDGTPTSLHAEHHLLDGLAGMIAARTSPSLNVQVEARIDVPTAAYTRQASVTPIQHEQMVLNYVQQEQIQLAEVMDLCLLSPDQTAKLLKRMKDKGALILQGERRWSAYRLG
uniref:AlbA family DNA-binding domain-containing protein n=1 Tax=Pseudomonas lijiangensis TaxID=2995658 RepID=UPI0020A65138|nr:ATP-binding protein [Pseudomonas lijiangensis]